MTVFVEGGEREPVRAAWREIVDPDLDLIGLIGGVVGRALESFSRCFRKQQDAAHNNGAEGLLLGVAGLQVSDINFEPRPNGFGQLASSNTHKSLLCSSLLTWLRA